jgi:ParB-like chromosome segregation protein Spo0J
MLDLPSTELVNATMRFHSFADLFPLMPQPELEVLAADIEQNGLHTPITVDPDGLGLDGRNHLRACLWAGVAHRTV